MAWRRRRAGRPRKDGARRRETTVAGRRGPDDHGSPELIWRKARVANGSTAPVEIIDVAGILFAHEKISHEELGVLRLLARWLSEVRAAFGIPAGSPGGLWVAITSGSGLGHSAWGLHSASGSSPGGDRALFRLVELHQHFAGPRRGSQLSRIMGVAAGERRPGNMAALLELRQGLREIGELQRRGRRHDYRVPAP